MTHRDHVAVLLRFIAMRGIAKSRVGKSILAVLARLSELKAAASKETDQ